MPRSLSMESQGSATQPAEHDEAWDDEDAEQTAARRPSAAARGGRKVSKDDHVPQTIQEESPQASPAASPVPSPRHSKNMDSPLAVRSLA